ncbi:Autophagy-related protein 2A [Manis javanica]|nr:Autophagy-related protein 2A [Manis javanica]
MRDLELPPLSPYSIKYAGHGIERGKLSMDVNYNIEPDGQLTARNKLVLHQLTFGEAVEGAPASLPVRLAVALLADRNGVIDLTGPVSGSLNDLKPARRRSSSRSLAT